MVRSLLAVLALLCLLSAFILAAPDGAADLAAKPQPTAAPAVPQTAGDWPMYGANPGHTSYDPWETAITPATLGRLVAYWQQPVTSGYTWPSSTPIISGGRVFVGGGLPSGPNFYAFAAADGTALWSADLGHGPQCIGVGVGATPAISGTVLIAGGGDDAYYRLDPASGAILWRHPLNIGPSGFPWASPLINGDRVYIGIASSCDNPQIRGEVRALNLADGSILNNQYFVPENATGASIWNSPALSPDGNTLVVTTGEDQPGYDGLYTRAMVSLDPLSLSIGQGHQEGEDDDDEDYNSSPTVFADDQGDILAVATHKDRFVYAYDLDTLEDGPIWSVPQITNTGLVPAYDPTAGPHGTVFFGSTDGVIHAVDATTGAERWASPFVGVVRGNLAILPGLVFANAGVNGMLILDEATGQILRTLVPDHMGGANSGVAISNGFVYWLSGNYLNAWSLADPRTPTVPPTTPTVAPNCVFLDVCEGDYYYTAVQYLHGLGAVSGYEDNTFRPYALVTRGQAMKILTVAFQFPPFTTHDPTFSDVPANHPFFGYIETAAHEHIISGYADGTFHPYANITRAQIAKVSVVAAGWEPVTPATSTFADVPAGHPFYTYVETAVCHTILSGYACGGPNEPCDDQQRPYFRPDGPATRGQVSKIIYNAVLGPPACDLAR